MTRKRTTVITIETDEVVIRRFPAALKTERNREVAREVVGEVTIETTCESEEATREKPNQETFDV